MKKPSKFLPDPPFGSYLWFKRVEEKAMAEALEELLAERKEKPPEKPVPKAKAPKVKA